MASQRNRTPESAIQEGRQHYAAKRFKPALEQFTRAMKLCPCARGMNRERCSCKNYEAVALEGGSIFKEAMYNCTCSVGKTFNKCDKALHIQALDFRAATFEAMEELERARKDAEWILELAPRLPDGYLRLGKITRLQNKPELAWKIYNAGIEVGNDNRLAGSPKLQKLYTARQPLQLRFCRKDPLRNPPEIVQRMVSHLDYASLVRCLRVSKEWRRFLTNSGNVRLWRSMLFTRVFPHRYAPSVHAVKKLASYSGDDLRKLVIDDVQRFRLNQPKFLAILQRAKNLEYLSLSGRTEEVHIPQGFAILSQLTHMILDDFFAGKPNILQPLMRHTAATLQHLQVGGLPQERGTTIGGGTDLGFPEMPNLKYLRLEQRNGTFPVRLEIFRIAANSPNLEQLWLSDIQLSLDGLGGHAVDHLWKNLKVLVVHDSTDSNIETAQIVRQLAALRRGNDLQHIDLDFRWTYGMMGPLGRHFETHMLSLDPASGIAGLARNIYGSMRSLRLARDLITPLKLQQVVHDSIMGNKLHTLDLVFPLEPLGVPPGHTSAQHLKEHEWLRGASSIRCLGVSEFRFRSYPKNDDDLPLPSFLASFPNLETLEINSGHYEPLELCSVIEAIIKVTKLKRIYQTSVQGVCLDQLRALASKADVELVWGERPRHWPVEIEE